MGETYPIDPARCKLCLERSGFFCEMITGPDGHFVRWIHHIGGGDELEPIPVGYCEARAALLALMRNTILTSAGSGTLFVN